MMRLSSVRGLPAHPIRWLLAFVLGCGLLLAASMAPAVAAATTAAPSAVPLPDGRRLAPDFARIASRGELVVAMLDTDTPPFFFVRDGQLVGLEVDLARSIAKELGVPVRFDRSAKTFNEVVEVVAAGKADLGISKLSRTLARMQRIRFSNPYLSLGHAVILNRLKFAQLAGDRTLPDVIRDYRGTLGVIAGSSFNDYAKRNFPNARLTQYASWPEVIAAVEKGDVIAAYRDEFEIKRLLRKDPAMALKFHSVTFKDLNDTLGVAVGINNTNLLAFVNEFLALSNEKLTVKKVLDYPER
jgi:ABC-type amino acid transport substrate-binding protein